MQVCYEKTSVKTQKKTALKVAQRGSQRGTKNRLWYECNQPTTTRRTTILQPFDRLHTGTGWSSQNVSFVFIRRKLYREIRTFVSLYFPLHSPFTRPRFHPAGTLIIFDNFVSTISRDASISNFVYAMVECFSAISFSSS